jgi:hypothetical protein
METKRPDFLKQLGFVYTKTLSIAHKLAIWEVKSEDNRVIMGALDFATYRTIVNLVLRTARAILAGIIIAYTFFELPPDMLLETLYEILHMPGD